MNRENKEARGYTKRLTITIRKGNTLSVTSAPMESELPIPFPGDVNPANRPRLLKALAEQIAKDLAPFDFGEIPENPNAAWISSALRQALNLLVVEQGKSLGAVLYRIDVNERKIKRAMAAAGSDERLDLLTQHVLEREAAKVWMRHNYTP